MGLCNISYNDKLFLNVYHPQLYHSKHVNLTIVVTSGVELNVLNRLFSLHTHAAQTLQLTRGAVEGDSPLGRSSRPRQGLFSE